MKKLLIAAAVATTLFAPQAFAQAKNFEGFSVGLNLDWIKVTPTQTNITIDEESSANLGLQGQYNLALGNQFVLGFGATVELTKPKAGTNPANSVSSKAINLSTAYLAPGFAVSDTTLLYGKVASVNTTVDYTGSSQTQTFSGLGYGIGVQNMLTKNWLVQVEFLSFKFDDKTIGTTVLTNKATNFSVGIGYKF